MTEYELAEKWMNQLFPMCRRVDVYWTMEKYDYPEFVRKWIKETWTKENDENGGTYSKKIPIATPVQNIQTATPMPINERGTLIDDEN